MAFGFQKCGFLFHLFGSITPRTAHCVAEEVQRLFRERTVTDHSEKQVWWAVEELRGCFLYCLCFSWSVSSMTSPTEPTLPFQPKLSSTSSQADRDFQSSSFTFRVLFYFLCTLRFFVKPYTG